MTLLNIEEFLASARSDFEFNREIRYFTGSIKLTVAGDKPNVMEFEDGRLVKVTHEDIPDADCKIFVKGTRAQWSELVKRYPPPFYQSIQTSCVMHGMTMSDSNETFAYLPALNRIVDILRNVNNPE